MITSTKRVFKAGFVGFWRNAYVSLASIFVMTVSLFVIGMTMFVSQLLETSMITLQSKVDISVYFSPGAPAEEVDRVRMAVEALPDVERVSFTSKEEALRQYREDNQDNAIALQALEELNENPLGSNIAVQAKETGNYEGIARFLDELKAQEQPQLPVIYDVDYSENENAINALTTIVGATERASYVVMIVLLLASILITFNTVRLAIYTSREEIAIMRLVGAGNMFIRGPFMLQGIMYGFISGVLALLLFYPILIWLGPRTEAFFELNLFTYYMAHIGEIFGVLVGIGIVLGFLSSTFAVARYLRT